MTGVTEDQLLIWLDEGTLNYRKIRLQLKVYRESNKENSLGFYYLKAAYVINRGFSKELMLFMQSDRGARYEQRMHFVSHIYLSLTKKFKTCMFDSVLKGDDSYRAANDDEFVDHRSRFTTHMQFAKFLMRQVVSFFETHSEVSKGERSKVYLAFLQVLMKMRGGMIEQGILVLNHNWKKSKPAFNNPFSNVVDNCCQYSINIMEGLKLQAKVMHLRPDAEKYQKRTEQLIANIRKNGKKAVHSDEVKSSWLKAAKDMKEKNQSLSVSDMACRIAGGKRGSYESIRKYLSNHL